MRRDHHTLEAKEARDRVKPNLLVIQSWISPAHSHLTCIEYNW